MACCSARKFIRLLPYGSGGKRMIYVVRRCSAVMGRSHSYGCCYRLLGEPEAPAVMPSGKTMRGKRWATREKSS